MQDAGVMRVGRITGVEEERPVIDGGEVLDVENVVWATGFRRHYPLIELDIFEQFGGPCNTWGVVEEVLGLYFVGLSWLHRAESSLIGGVGKDAEHIVGVIQKGVG